MPHKEKLSRCLLMSSIEHANPWGFFYGTCQITPSIYGARDVPFLDSSHFLLLKYVARQETNNNAEFYSLWLSMKMV
jgi:hypothetical protein